MAEVIIDGIFMGASIQTKTYEGNTKTSLVVDVYQPNSEQNSKSVQLKTDDISLYDKISKTLDTGSVVKIKAAVNAYKNTAYYKLLSLVE